MKITKDEKLILEYYKNCSPPNIKTKNYWNIISFLLNEKTNNFLSI